ncbi:Binding-protein-dependent transport (system) inner membrane component [Pseudomonas savastanoi pv. savastanoi]|nr:Binding-protein-dependent transport (system) inner membrane component [Pseudomonas savastanoi pv. savastanoi]RMT89965.1 Binding-protein-dependent transport (system) inner membrane component [Pseudomonas savastanoi pv. nerii]
MSLRKIIPLWIYLLFLLVPIYWLINMSFKTNTEILGGLTLWPQDFTLANYKVIFTDESWYSGYLNSLYYVCLNTVISLSVALPAAYAFSRYRFLGDKHLFFWLLTNRMAPPAVFLLPFFQLYSSIGLFDTHIAVALAHCLFNVPLAVWILEGFMSGVPKEIDETAYIDGYSFPKFFVKIFIPLIGSGIGVTAFFCFMFSWVELLLARTLTSVNAKPIAAVMTRTVSASGIDWGGAGGGGGVDYPAGYAGDLVRSQPCGQGLCSWSCLRSRKNGVDVLDTAHCGLFHQHRIASGGDDRMGVALGKYRAPWFSADCHHAWRPFVHWASG